MQFAPHVLINTLVKLSIRADVKEMEGFLFEDCGDVNHTFRAHSWMATHDSMHSPALCFCLLATSHGKIETFPPIKSLIISCQSDWIVSVQRRAACFLGLFSSSSLPDSAASSFADGRVLYKWCPLDFQFAVLWVFQAAAPVLQRGRQSWAAPPAQHQMVTPLLHAPVSLWKKKRANVSLSVALNIKVVPVETTICYIVLNGGENGVGWRRYGWPYTVQCSEMLFNSNP